jgi:HEAT repeat protein
MNCSAFASRVCTTTILLLPVLLCPGNCDEPLNEDQPAAKTPAVEEPSERIANLLKLTNDPDPFTRTWAIREIAAIDPTLESSIPTILQLLKNPEEKTRSDTISALSEYGPPSGSIVATLKPLVADPELGLHVMWLLGKMGPNAEETIPDLAKLLDKGNQKQRDAAATALTHIGPKAAVAVPGLIDRIKSISAVKEKMDALVEVWPVSRSEIVKMLHDSDPVVRYSAIKALGSLEPEGFGDLLPWLRDVAELTDDANAGRVISYLQSTNRNVLLYSKLFLFPSISKTGPATRGAAPSFVRMLDDPDPEFRLLAKVYLCNIAPSSTTALQGIRRFLRDEDITINNALVSSLLSCNHPNPEVVDDLIVLLENKNAEIRYMAANILGDIGPDAKSALPKLKNLLDDKDFENHKAALKALMKIDPDPDMLLAELRNNSIYDSDILRIMTDLGPKAKPAMPYLVKEFLANESGGLPSEFFDILGNFGAEAQEVVPILIKKLKKVEYTPADKPDPNWDRIPAAEALAKIKPKGEEVVSALAEMLEDDDMNTRLAAAEALIALGLQALKALPAVAALLQCDEDWAQQRIAFELGKLDSQAGKAVLPMIDALPQSNDPDTEHYIALAKALINRDNKKAVPELTRILYSSHFDLKLDAARLLASMGKDAEPAVPALIKLLRAKDYSVRTVDTIPFKVFPGFQLYEAASGMEDVAKAALPKIIEMQFEPGIRQKYIHDTLLKMGSWAPLETIKLLRDSRRQVRIGAAYAINDVWPRYCGDAADELIKMLQGPDPVLRWSAIGGLGTMGPEGGKRAPEIAALLKHKDSEIRLVAAAALVLLSPEAKAVIPDIRAALGDASPPVRARACAALGAIGPDAKAALADLAACLKDDDPEVRFNSLWALGEMLPIPDDLVPVVARFMSERTAGFRGCAIYILGRTGTRGVAAARQELIALLKDQDASTRAWAVSNLGQPWLDGKKSLPDIAGMLNDDDWNVRLNAVAGLGRIGPDSAKYLYEMMSLQEDREPKVQSAVVEALIEIDPEGKQVVPMLIKFFKSNSGMVVVDAIKSVRKIKPPAKLAMPSLISMLNDNTIDMNIRLFAVAALGDMGADAKVAAPELIRLLGSFQISTNSGLVGFDFPSNQNYLFDVLKKYFQDDLKECVKFTLSPDPTIRIGACRVLGILGSKAEPAVPDIVRLFGDESLNVRVVAVYALGQIRGKPEVAVPGLIKLLSAEEPTVRSVAAESLGHFGPAAKAAAPDLMKLFKDKDENVRRTSGWTFTCLGSARKDSIPELMALLKDANKYAQSTAIYELGDIGPDAKAALPALMSMVGDDPSFRPAIATALGNFGAEAVIALPLLRQLQSDPDESVQYAAAASVKQIEEKLKTP